MTSTPLLVPVAWAAARGATALSGVRGELSSRAPVVDHVIWRSQPVASYAASKAPGPIRCTKPPESESEPIAPQAF
jgi:hypothetical protein